MAALQVSCRRVDTLRLRKTNPRTHSRAQIMEIARSIEEFGFTNPILIDGNDSVVAGHGRLAAAKLLGLEEVPTVALSNMTEAQVRAYVIADNRIAEKAGWDKDLLAIELRAILDICPDFDLTLSGFEMGEIDLTLGSSQPSDLLQEILDSEEPAEREGAVPVTEVGDIWQVGPHRLMCADATDPLSFKLLLAGDVAQMVFTDPPYNVPISGHVCGKGRVQHGEFAMASGEMSRDAFKDFLELVFANLAEVSCNGAVHFVCMDWRHVGEISAAGDASYDKLLNICVWAKTNGGMGTLYRSAHEFVFVFKAGDGKPINNVRLGRYGRNRTNVWHYPGQNAFGKTRDLDLAAHPTVKPVALVSDAISDCSMRGGIVLDAFVGSGTTLLAAHSMGRRGYGLEIAPKYCDGALARLSKAVGASPVLAGSNLTFDEVKALRHGAKVGGDDDE